MSDNYGGYGNIDTKYDEYADWARNKKDLRIRDLTDQVEALSAEVKRLHDLLDSVHARVMAA